MTIQWFPGHMAAARKKASETMEQVDVIIEVLDARAPEASRNPMIEELRQHRQRPCLKILNKTDLADPQITKQWITYYNKQPKVKAVALSCKNASDANRIPQLCQQLAPHRDSALKPLRMMIMGIPNVGKSTLMNSLLKKKLANVGDEPAVTKSQQKLALSPQLTLIDSPGLLWPKIEQPADGLMLATINAVGRNAIYEEEIAEFLADILLQQHATQLSQRYKISCNNMDASDLIIAIARRRGCLLKGSNQEADLEKAALILLTDFRNGKLGRISLESPSNRSQLLCKYPPTNQETLLTDDSQTGDETA